MKTNNDRTRKPTTQLPGALPSAAVSGCDARIEKLRARQNAIRLERIAQMLKDAGVPEWVQTIDTGPVPSNAPDYRLEWFLARRKNVKPAEIDMKLQKEMEDWMRILSQRHNDPHERTGAKTKTL